MFVNIFTKFGKNPTKTTELRERTTFVDAVHPLWVIPVIQPSGWVNKYLQHSSVY